MNSLVGFGSVAAFAISLVSPSLKVESEFSQILLDGLIHPYWCKSGLIFHKFSSLVGLTS